ncbi:MAG: GNAT family N-acetyltransferase [Bacteroidia bacterium]|nr:GNAT family N-acetyltransferase [Bacteroidota bacterium]MBK7571306.1 GNAT family N-acetyltransferase [Bacteroidota bacterium]MBK8585068.1 GNAT family N-acetyltransferase [Bacteroidota bacterium]MBP9790564.1 GNAT family N-acetyltransferase [Bacteroidia bacterium]MBP9923354.1 GNAT family N-acetyltransferase [Bacteroidia bacterium]
MSHEIQISTNKSLLQLDIIHNVLKNSYWAKGIPIETIKRSIENSISFGVYIDGKQIGFCRVITDKATFAYLADVFIVEEHKGKGYSKLLMKYVLAYPELQGLRKFLLGTADAHGLYKQFGFKELAAPERMMEITFKDIYLKQ